jgi:hypothetical protein
MSFKRTLLIFSLLFGCAVVLVVGFVVYKLAPFFGGRELPPELREARVVNGEGFLARSEFHRVGGQDSWRELFDPDKLKSRFDPTVDVAVGQLDGREGLDVGLVGRFGVTLLDRRGQVTGRINYQFQKETVTLGPLQSEQEQDNFGVMRLVDVEGDGACEVLGYDGLDGAALFSHQGQVLFRRGAYKQGESYIKEVAAGDVDGDGELEFVASWGYEPWNGVELFDRHGNTLWRREEPVRPGQIEMVDVDGDSRIEFVEEDGQQLKIRDAQGKVVGSASMPVYLWHLSLCPRPDGGGPPQNLAVREGSLWLIDLDGKNFSKFEAPLSQIRLDKPREMAMPGVSDSVKFDKEEVYRARGVWVRLKQDRPKYLAVIANFGVLDRSLLYVYDERGGLVYHEILPEQCHAVAVLPPEGEGGAEEVLVGGEKTVWRYAAR